MTSPHHLPAILLLHIIAGILDCQPGDPPALCAALDGSLSKRIEVGVRGTFAEVTCSFARGVYTRSGRKASVSWYSLGSVDSITAHACSVALDDAARLANRCEREFAGTGVLGSTWEQIAECLQSLGSRYEAIADALGVPRSPALQAAG